MNICIFTGNVANDPELKGQNQNVLTFRLAVNGRQYNSETGQYEDHADFVDCVMYGKRCEPLSKILAKGFPVTVQAHAHQNTWQDADGNNRSRIEFLCDDIALGKAKA